MSKSRATALTSAATFVALNLAGCAATPETEDSEPTEQAAAIDPKTASKLVLGSTTVLSRCNIWVSGINNVSALLIGGLWSVFTKSSNSGTPQDLSEKSIQEIRALISDGNQEVFRYDGDKEASKLDQWMQLYFRPRCLTNNVSKDCSRSVWLDGNGETVSHIKASAIDVLATVEAAPGVEGGYSELAWVPTYILGVTQKYFAIHEQTLYHRDQQNGIEMKKNNKVLRRIAVDALNKLDTYEVLFEKRIDEADFSQISGRQSQFVRSGTFRDNEYRAFKTFSSPYGTTRVERTVFDKGAWDDRKFVRRARFVHDQRWLDAYAAIDEEIAEIRVRLTHQYKDESLNKIFGDAYWDFRESLGERARGDIPIREGIFRDNGWGIYYSNGSGAFCKYGTMEEFLCATGRTEALGTPRVAHPVKWPKMVFDGTCASQCR